MPDLRTALMQSHQKNIDRYCRLLSTPLSELERAYIHQRIAVERLELERVQSVAASIESKGLAGTSTVIATDAMSRPAAGHSQA